MSASRHELKVGILGGTFNPPHFGHLRLAEEAAYMHGLEGIIFIPCFIPPHKGPEHVAPAMDRLCMTKTACRENALFRVSDLEILSGGPSYTVRTLEALAEDDGSQYFFIMGTDSLAEVGSWKEYEKLFSLADFIVVRRPGLDFSAAWAAAPKGLRDRFRQVGDRLAHAGGKSLIPSMIRGLDISSTRIRSLIGRGKSIRYLVPDSVMNYINERGLYRCRV
ncbi:MAG: nicotinate-nucleotide adenylyltransferase [Pseudomonadota bacterium]